MINNKKAVFFDRDGTINSDIGHYYIYRISDFTLNEGIAEGMKRLYDAGYLIFVVTNQGGVAKKLYSAEDVESVNSYMCDILKDYGIRIEKVYYCPHHDSVSPCECRKPKPGMLITAMNEYGLTANNCFMIGDSNRDTEAAERAGIRGIKIDKNGSIKTAVDYILNQDNDKEKVSGKTAD